MCAPKAPAAPDPVVTANAQTQSNIATATNNAALNRVNQYTPYGNSTYSIDGTNAEGAPQYSQTISLSPSEQNLFSMGQQGAQTLGQTALGTLGTLQNNFSQPFSASGLPQVTGSVQNPSTGIASQVANPNIGVASQVNGGQSTSDAIKSAQDAAYKSQTQYLDPQFQQAGKALDNSLINQGITQGSEAYNNAQTTFGNQKQQAYQGAQNAATLAGQGEQNTLFGQGLSAAGLQNQAQQQLYGQNLSGASLQNEAQQQQFGQNLSGANLQNQASAQALNQQLGLYNQPLNTYNALATGAQVQNPNFTSVPATNQAGTDVAGITNSAYQNQLAQYQQQQAGINNLFSLGGSLGSAAIFKSDRRLKRNIKRVGQTGSGIPVYDFQYIWDGERGPVYRGVMADEVRHIPNAVIPMPNGFDAVNYAVLK